MREELFARSEFNPLIQATDLPYQANAVFNAGAVDLGDEVLLLMRVESCSGRSHLIVARSADGVTNWEVEDRALLHSSQGCRYETNGVEDCRITYLEELEAWLIVYTAYSEFGPGVAIASTKDFKSVDRLGLVRPPDDKNATLFPTKFGGEYAMLHRPPASGGSIWISYSDDLVYWGKPQMVLHARGAPWWDGTRVGAGLPPIRIDQGWLLIYHGVKELASAPLYRLGGAILDAEEPEKVVARSRRWLLGPREPYERTGDADNVVFACGGFVRDGDLWMYYGAGDCSICLARAPVAGIIDVVCEDPIT